MPGPHSAGEMKQLVTNEQGTILPIMAVLVVVLTLLFAGLAEFGRYLILREQTQTASDAAALAASYSNVRRKVKIDVITDRGEREVCDCDESGCTCWCEGCGTVTKHVTGYEKDLIDNEGWRAYCVPPCSCGGGSCWYEIKDRWVEYSPSYSRDTAEAFALLNTPDQAKDVWLDRLVVHGDRSDKYYPSVVAYVKSRMGSLFPGLFGVFPGDYQTETCSQGDTFYIVPGTGKWRKAPPDACWKD